MNTVDVRCISEWDENTPIAWWNAGRKRLNDVIRDFNSWQRKASVTGWHDAAEGREILAAIDEGSQTWAAVDGGGGWLDELTQMKDMVEATL